MEKAVRRCVRCGGLHDVEMGAALFTVGEVWVVLAQLDPGRLGGERRRREERDHAWGIVGISWQATHDDAHVACHVGTTEQHVRHAAGQCMRGAPDISRRASVPARKLRRVVAAQKCPYM